MSPVRSTLQATLCALALTPVTVAAETAQPGGSTFFAGIDVDNQDSRRLSLGLLVHSDAGTSFELVGVHSETDSDTLDLSSNYGFGQLSRDFGRFGLAAGVRHMRDDDLSKTLGWLGSGFVDFTDSRVTVSLESRETDFDEVDFTATGEELDLEGVTSATGTAACSVASLAYGLRLDVIRPEWNFYTAATTFNYGSHRCDTTITETTDGAGPGPVIPAPISVRRPAVVENFVANAGGGFAGYSATLLPYDGALLESSLMLGASIALGERRSLGFELYRSSEEFASSETRTALAYLEYRIAARMALTFAAGATESDEWDRSVFAGVRISASMGR